MAHSKIDFAAERLLEDHTITNPLPPKLPVALISDSGILLRGLQHLLHGTQFDSVEAFPSRDSSGGKLLACNTALVVIDANQDVGRVLELVRSVREHAPATKIVALADQLDLRLVRLGLEAGVDGFCHTASRRNALVKCLELIMLGEATLPSATVRSLFTKLSRTVSRTPECNNLEAPKSLASTRHNLSVREAEVLNCLMEGAPNKIIARKLDLAEATVKVHVKAVLRKIGAANRTQAAMWATGRLRAGGAASINA
ncbi:LuxR C-terminal-related transcriptional regulator [Microvirga sp. GCM10011540]|uniref:response regulator transcription factor n=1 Tax=Microvirga sp. GCM10011540 TaxID=3317338 RepID=UPI003611B2BD